MAVPKFRVSRTRRDSRRAQYKKRFVNPAPCLCPQCGAAKLPHRVCKSCGSYKGREVIKMADFR